MDAIRELFARFRSFFRNEARNEDFDAELSSHLDLLIEENLRRGMSAGEARRQVLISIGGIDQTNELHRDSRGLPLIETILQDVQHSLRALRNDAGLATFAILIIGLGVGASTTVFSVVNALLLRPLAFEDPERLVWVANNDGAGLSAQTIQVGHLLDLREENRSFTDIAAYFAFYGNGDSKLTGAGEPERLTTVPVSENFFPLLGVQPQIGRLFTSEECKWNGPRAVLLSHHVWVRRFASDSNIVGRPITINESPVTVAGVLPASFDFGAVFAPGRRIDLYSPFPLSPETNRWGNTSALIARLKPGATVESARAEVAVLAEAIRSGHPERNTLVPEVTGLRDHVSGQFRSAMILLTCAVGLVMLIVCSNLSNLLLARSVTRQKEIAIRAALGAGKMRLVRQMLTESLVLSCGGALLGLLLAVGGIRVLASLDAISIPLLSQLRPDAAVLVFALSLAMVTGILFGLTPALRLSTIALHGSLKESGRGSSESKGHGWIRGGLVVGEIAMACTLLVGAGLLLRSFLRVLDVDLGFQPASAIALRVDPSSQYSTQESRNQYFSQVLLRVRATPGIQEAGLTDALPLGTNRSWGVGAKGKIYDRTNYPEAFVRIVSDGYLGAMGISLVSGRDFSERDTLSSKPVIIINETLARRLWPGEDPIGRILRTDRPEREVIGVVRDVRHLALEEESGSEMYLPIRQTNDYGTVDIVVRGTHPPADLVSGVRAALTPLDPNLPANTFRTLQDLVDRSVSPRRFLVLLLTGFAGFAVILASLGIYGIISYSVSRRRQEIGIRMALGASAGDLQKRILFETLKLAAIGMLIGVTASWILSRAVEGLLFGVTPTDPMSFAFSLVLLTVVAALAGYFPARRASRLDPVDTLRAA